MLFIDEPAGIEKIFNGALSEMQSLHNISVSGGFFYSPTLHEWWIWYKSNRAVVKQRLPDSNNLSSFKTRSHKHGLILQPGAVKVRDSSICKIGAY